MKFICVKNHAHDSRQAANCCSALVETSEDIRTEKGNLVGRIIRTERGSHFVQVKRVPRGACVNLGMRFPRFN